MKKLAALVFLSAGLFGLFPDDVQAQRARWSGQGSNSEEGISGKYEFFIDSEVQDSNPENTAIGSYLQAVSNSSFKFDTENLGSFRSSLFGDLIISKIAEQIEIKILFNNESPITSFSAMIDISNFENELKNPNVNNLSEFNKYLSLIAENLSSLDASLGGGIGLKPQQNGVSSLNIDNIKVKNIESVPEPSLISAFMILFSVSLTGMLNKIKVQNH